MKVSQITAGEGQGGAWASPSPIWAGRPGSARVAYCAALPAGESREGLTNLVRARRLDADGAERI